MQDYTNSMSSLSEVQRIIGLSLSKIQIGRNQRGGLPLHKNLLVATVLNKARDLYMQETMYMNYKMMTGQLGAAQMTCMAMHAPPSCPSPTAPHLEESEEEVPEQPAKAAAAVPADVSPPSPPPIDAPVHNSSRASDEGFIDEPDCDCDARNFSSESSRVPFTYCYQCAPFHPSNGRGPTLVPAAAKSSLEASGGEENQTQHLFPPTESTSSGEEPAPSTAGGFTTIYDMDSKATELRSNSHSSRKRRLSDPSESFSGGKRNRTNSCPEENLMSQEPYSFPPSPSSSSSSSEEVFHPAFRQCGPNSPHHHHHQFHPPGSSSGNGASMEIEQITSLVSIFSFGQQIMAAAVEANKRLQQKSSSFMQKDEDDPTDSSNSGPEEEDSKCSPGDEEVVSEDTKTPKKDDDSDSESDTSSDSGHSSDDLEAASPDESVVDLKSNVGESPPSTTASPDHKNLLQIPGPAAAAGIV